jgi:hypothetical protein
MEQNAWSRIFLEKLTVSQLVKKFPAFYGIRIFITACRRARHLSLLGTGGGLFCPSCPSSHLLKSHLFIIFPPTPGSYKWSLSLRCVPTKALYAVA